MEKGSFANQSMPIQKFKNFITPWPWSESELYRPSDRRLSAKLVPTFADRVCRVVSATDPYGRILGFLDQRRRDESVSKVTETTTCSTKVQSLVFATSRTAEFRFPKAQGFSLFHDCQTSLVPNQPPV
jgi:hypothetical protein